MTAEEALTLIETAACPRALFGRDAGRDYRRLARLTHPDAHPGSPRAAAAFARLAALWRQHCGRTTPGRLSCAGDIANLYEHERGLVKIARDPADNDLMDREAAALRGLQAGGDARLRPYVPALVECQRHRDPDTGAERRANVLGRLYGFVTLAEVHAAYPGGLDARDAAWMWRRLLVAAGFAHRAGVIHAAVLPEHVLIHPAQHGLVLVDWCYSITAPGGLAAAVPARYASWYPPEVGDCRPPGPDLDIWLTTWCMTQLIGDPIPAPLAAFARGCTLRSPGRRPADAWRLLAELDAVLERLYGPRKFRPFTMPA
ncbi:MAG: molecular chaperone DnaJ [Streptosporangiaceae bacterium]